MAGCWGIGDGIGYFVASELVQIPSGLTPISQLEKGDTVVSYNEKLDKMTTSTIGGLIVYETDDNDYEESPLLGLKLD